MKKKLLGAAAAIALLAFPSCTAAATTVTLETSVPSTEWIDASWIYGTDLIMYSEGGNYCIMDHNGQRLTDAIYDYSFESQYGLICCKPADGGTNSIGALNESMEEVIPFSYGQITSYTANWFVCYVLSPGTLDDYDIDHSDGSMVIDTVDIYYRSGESVSKVATLTRDQFSDFYSMGDYITIENRTDGSCTLYDSSFQPVAENLESLYDFQAVTFPEEYTTTWNDNAQALCDKDGNVLFEVEDLYIMTVENGYVSIADDQYWGLMDLAGNVIVPVEYDMILEDYAYPYPSYVSAGYICVEKDGKLGFYSTEGELTVEPGYSYEMAEANGASLLITDAEGNNHIIAGDGTDTTLDASLLNPYAMYTSHGLLYQYDTDNYGTGVIDWHGNEVLPVQEGYQVSLSASGKWLLSVPDYTTLNIYSVEYDQPLDAGIADASVPAADSADGDTEAVTEGAAEDEAMAVADDITADDDVAAADDLASGDDTAADDAAAGDDAAVSDDTAATGQASADQGSNSAVKALIDSALALINSDFEGSQASILSILESAKSLLGSGDPSVVSLLDSAVTLINSGAADGASIAAILQSVSSFLG